MNAIGLSILIVVLLVVIGAPRRWAWLGVVAGALYLTYGQQVNVAGFNMYAMRFIELAGFARVMLRGEFSFSKMNQLDRTLVALYLYTTIVFLLRSDEGKVYEVGTAVDAFLCYFTFRGLCTNIESFKWFLRAFLILLVPYTALVLIESVTAHNIFSVVGGLVLNGTWIRAGRVRCVASFRNPSLLGTLGATFLPLYIGYLLSKGQRATALIGFACCLTIIWASNSGGPAGCAVVGIIGWLMWNMRTRMQWFRRGMVALIAAAALLMKAPIWYLLARVSDLSGGDGFHRARLMDMAFKNMDKWWLAGMATRDTAGWFPYVLAATGGADLTNNYLMYGIGAGLGSLILFLLLLTRAFSSVGKSLIVLRSNSNPRRDVEYLFWGMGVMLATHVFNWFGITYFDQTNALWFMQLAIVSNLTQEVLESRATPNDAKIRMHGLRKPTKSRSVRPQLVRPSGMLSY